MNDDYGSAGIEPDPLFTGLTRPAMAMGVHYMFFMVNMLACMIIFVNTKNFVALFVMFPILHGIAYLICLKEPRAIELCSVRYGKFSRCKNRVFHNFTNSYDL